MIEVIAKHPEHVTMRIAVGRLGVGLDNWAINELAEDPGPLRERFLRTLQNAPTFCFQK